MLTLMFIFAVFWHYCWIQCQNLLCCRWTFKFCLLFGPSRSWSWSSESMSSVNRSLCV